MGCLGRIPHDAGGRLCRITAQNGNQSSVGAETVGIEPCEEDALVGYRVQLYSHILLCSHRRHEVAGEAFHNHEKYIGCSSHSLWLEQRIGVFIALTGHGGENLICFLLVHKAILLGEILLMSKRLHQTEHRVHCRMVYVTVLAEIYFASIGGRNRYTSSDGKE